ncbi:hypothetical protein L6164_034845 [Bauhinia variegata]|uniref:Uncharacterized protein n=1 Tax=Bauhinia variegata TaxID=167791 RepID=A0ACB9KWT1_BAUVA|nr:hypothetical protein L6164_034845 [Bauhinia variegata]
MRGKALVSTVSLILVVGVIVGVVAVVNIKKDNNHSATANVKAVQNICQNAEDQKLCRETLIPAKGSPDDPKAYFKTAIEAATNSIIKALNMSDKLSVEHGNKDPGIKMALDDCRDLMQYSIANLQSSADLVNNNDILTVHYRTDDFKNWLTSTIACQQTCMDGFDTDGEKKVQELLQSNGLDDMGKLTGMTLDIVASFAKILESFNLNLKVNPSNNRRLLNVEVDKEGFPTWFSAADRKLLRKFGKGGHRRGSIGMAANAVVAQDGSGTHKTIADAIAAVPKKSSARFVIYVKAGIYNENVIVPNDVYNVLMYGDGPTRTIVTGHKNFAAGTKTMNTATFAAVGNGFIAKSIGFENTAGWAGHQAVALRVQSDMSAFFDCAIHGYQDSLYLQSDRQFYRNCEISGTVDFIFGTSTSLIQNSKIIVRRPGPKQFNTVTADGSTQKTMISGIVIQNCEIVPENELFPVRFQVRSYLGRPWKAYSRTVIMESTIGDFIQPDGWAPWSGNSYLNTLYYAEYNNRGPGAALDRRVRWKGYRGAISRAEANQFTADVFLKGGATGSSDWLRVTGIPYQLSFTTA